jgi:hypothetical protein
MNIETFPQATSNPAYRPVQDQPRFDRIGAAWELRLVAETYDLLGTSHLIVSDGLAYLVDRLIHDATIDRFVRLLDEDSDYSDVCIASFLFEDLREGCALLADAIADDQRSAHPRILESAARLVFAACHRIRLLG